MDYVKFHYQRSYHHTTTNHDHLSSTGFAMSDDATRSTGATNDYREVTADAALEDDLRALVRLSIAEDLRSSLDWTTVCLIDADDRGGCQIVPRQRGVCAGLATLPWIIDEFDADLEEERVINDGETLAPGQPIARLRGNVRDLLTSERTILNIICRLCGIATQTRQYVDQIASTGVRLYDTRKTTPGWRLLEKYAVHCGGGHNHRSGLYDGFLIKDNHLALAGDTGGPMAASSAAEKAIRWRGSQVERMTAPTIVEIEVDSIAQLRDVLPVSPDIVLLDNFSLDQLREAVGIRDAAGSGVELEASGNVRIDTIAEIAATGVDRISSGALTHQATSLDLGLDWFDAAAS
jgi:nicotinate-nucleotide pyrophosphorylase (carboxylating)